MGSVRLSGKSDADGMARALPSRSKRLRLVSRAILLCIIASIVFALLPRLRLAYHLYLARERLAVGDAEQALRVLADEEKSGRESAELQFLLGVAHRRANHLHKSGPYFDRAEALGWPLKQLRPQRQMAAFQAGDLAAEAELQAMLARPMDDEMAEQLCESLTKGYFAKFWLNQAKRCLDHWVFWQPGNPRPRQLRAMLYELSDDLDAEMDEYRAIIRAEPNNFSAHVLLAQALLKKNDVDRSLVEYRRCLELSPRDAPALLGAAMCLRRKGDVKSARKLVEEVTPHVPRSRLRGRLLRELGELDLEEGLPERALEHFRQAIQLLPFDAPTHYSYGMALARTGKAAEAKPVLKHAGELEQRHYRIFDIEHQLAIKPDDPDLRYEAAMLMMEQDMGAQAETLLLTALTLDPNHAPTHAALADWYERQGKLEKAAKHRELAGEDSGTDGAGGRPSDGRPAAAFSAR